MCRKKAKKTMNFFLQKSQFPGQYFKKVPSKQDTRLPITTLQQTLHLKKGYYIPQGGWPPLMYST